MATPKLVTRVRPRNLCLELADTSIISVYTILAIVHECAEQKYADECSIATLRCNLTGVRSTVADLDSRFRAIYAPSFWYRTNRILSG